MNAGTTIGIDLGGTKIHAGVVAADGQILSQLRRPTEADQDAETIFRNVVDAARAALAESGLATADVSGVGLGSPGPMDIRTGVLFNENNLPTMYDFPIVERLGEALGLPVVLNNDANCLGLAEALFGAGRGSDVCCGFTLGTGLGCFVVIDGRLHSGPRGAAGEVWCSPHAGEFIEESVSGRAVARNYKRISGKDADALAVSRLAIGGDAHAREAYLEFGRALAVPVAWVGNTLDADVVVLGGSIANAWTLFYDAMLLEVRKYLNPITRETIRIVPVALGDEAGMLGAAALAR